jgi:hypothetical protein
MGRSLEQRLAEPPLLLIRRSQEELRASFTRRRLLRAVRLLPYPDPLVLPAFQGTSGQVDDPKPQNQRDHEEAQHPRELPHLRRQKVPPPVISHSLILLVIVPAPCAVNVSLRDRSHPLPALFTSPLSADNATDDEGTRDEYQILDYALSLLMRRSGSRSREATLVWTSKTRKIPVICVNGRVQA